MPPRLPGVGSESRLFDALFSQQQARQQQSQFDDQQRLRQVALGLQGADLLAGNIQQERQRGFEAGEAGLERDFRAGQAEQLAEARLAEIDAQQSAISGRAGLDRAVEQDRLAIQAERLGLTRQELEAALLAQEEDARIQRERVGLEERRVGLREREFEAGEAPISDEDLRRLAMVEAIQALAGQVPPDQLAPLVEQLLAGPAQFQADQARAAQLETAGAASGEFRRDRLAERAATRRNRAPQLRPTRNIRANVAPANIQDRNELLLSIFGQAGQ